HVALQICVSGSPNAPARVIHPVLDSGPARSPGISPVVLGDELVEGAVLDELRRSSDGCGKAVFAALERPRVRNALNGAGGILRAPDAVTHRHCLVVLTVEQTCNERDGTSRDDFFDEDDTSAPFVLRLPADVETQIDFLEVAVERDGDAAN